MKRLLLAALFFFSIIINVKANDTLDIKKWKSYYIKDANVKFSYPDFILHLDSTGNQFNELHTNLYNLNHSIQYKHPYPCNFESIVNDSSDRLTDLGFSITCLKTNLEGALDLTEDYIRGNYFFNDTLKTEKGFIDKVKVGNLKGYKIQEGAEGCGRYKFIFPIDDKLTLEINMPYAADYNIREDNQTVTPNFLFVKGLMTPKLSEKIFYMILETIK